MVHPSRAALVMLAAGVGAVAPVVRAQDGVVRLDVRLVSAVDSDDPGGR